MININNSKGFTLVEVIISIAILSVASVVALQLFITSQEMNEDSRHADIASVEATNIIETIRGCDATSSMLEHIQNMETSANGFTANIYLSDSFDPLQGDSPNSDGIYLLACSLNEETPGLYEVLVSVTEIESDKALAVYSTHHYFKREVTSNDL